MKKIVFEDIDGNELKCHINDHDKLYLSAGKPDADFYYTGYICLDKEDVVTLIDELKRLLSEM